MEVAALCFGPWLAVMVLLVTDVRSTAASASLRVAPDRQQFFQYETVTFSCESELGGGVLHMVGGKLPQCSPSYQSYPNRSTCTVKNIYPTDNGTYVCVFGGRPGSNNINITVTEANVILESPALPVMEGQAVSLSCRSKTVTSGSAAHFYKDGNYIGSSMSMSMSIDTVSKSDEGLYRCRIGGVGESAESWLSITVANVILESPALPVMEGQPVSLNCRSKTVTSGSTADFYKDGSHIGSSPAGSMSMSIDTVSKSDEGLYRCRIGGVGESAESWLSVTAVADGNTPPGRRLHILLPALLGVLLLAGLLLVAVLCSRRRRPAAEAPPTAGPQGESSQVIYAKVSHHGTRAEGAPLLDAGLCQRKLRSGFGVFAHGPQSA